MRAKEYLQQIQQINAIIEDIQAEIDSLRKQVTIRSPWPDGQPHGSSVSDPVGKQAAILADELIKNEEYLLKWQRELWRKRMEIVEEISKLEKPEHNRLLYLRYVQCERWEQIACEMNYSYQWVAGPLHGNALQEFEKIINC